MFVQTFLASEAEHLAQLFLVMVGVDEHDVGSEESKIFFSVVTISDGVNDKVPELVLNVVHRISGLQNPDRPGIKCRPFFLHVFPDSL